MKDSYRIAKILKKITGVKFVGKQHTPDISEAAKVTASKYEQNRKKLKPLGAGQQQTKAEDLKERDRYVQYQKEVEAERLIGRGNQPVQPGKILKLPVNRKKIDLTE